jgi:alginate O-acetyltransferase complex protein AlgI
MNFNSPSFLFLFFPISLLFYFIVNPRWRLWIGLAASLLFFAWGQAFNLPVMIAVIVINYFIGFRITADRKKGKSFPWAVFGVVINLLILVFYKYFTTFGSGLAESLGFSETVIKLLDNLQFPVGLSYITFQVISYLLDVHKEICENEKNFIVFALYILLFPKILVGPIVRYNTLKAELNNPQVNVENITEGIRRFIQGLAKKVLIADTLGKLVTPVFQMSAPNIAPAVSWLILIAFTIQIYFDFSGITDMAIGMGKMLGFHFMENFNFPYIARSISDFWRRWHISLSSWFRDYVFYPLELNRTIRLGRQLDILIIFLLTGLWHGFTPPFIIWGLINGVAVAFESTRLGRKMNVLWPPLQHLYALAVILTGWVFFRSPNFEFAFAFFKRLGGDASGLTPLSFINTRPLPIIEPSIWIALGLGILFSLPIVPAVKKYIEKLTVKHLELKIPLLAINDGFLIVLLVFSIAMIASGNYAPGIYGRF